MNVVERLLERFAVQGVGNDDFRAGPGLLAPADRRPHHDPDLVAADEKLRDEPATDVSRGARHQDGADAGDRAGSQIMAEPGFVVPRGAVRIFLFHREGTLQAYARSAEGESGKFPCFSDSAGTGEGIPFMDLRAAEAG